MRGARINKLLIGGGIAAALMLALAATLFYGAKKKHDLEAKAVSHIATATAQLQDGFALPLEAQGAAGRLEERTAAVAQLIESLKREDAMRNRALAEAAELYLVEAHAILRNRGNAARARAAALASRRALAGHMAAAGGRGPGWIQNALALKQRAERDSFDYRNALGTYAALLKGHRETQDKVRAVRPGVRLLEDAQVQAALKAAADAEQQAVADLERLRAMAIPR
jgi:hypothetical protein